LNSPGNSPRPLPLKPTSILDTIYSAEEQEKLTKDDLQLLRRYYEEILESPSSEKRT